MQKKNALRYTDIQDIFMKMSLLQVAYWRLCRYEEFK